MNFKVLLAAKTFWLGITTIVGGAILIKQGNLNEGILGVINGLGLIFIRDAIAKQQ